MAHPTAAFDQAVAVQHRMDGALGRDLDPGEPADQALSDFPCTPAGALALYVQDKVLHLKRKLMGIPTGTPAPIGESLNSTLLVAIEDLVAGLAGDPELPAEFRHRLAGEQQTADVHPLPNTPSKASLPPRKGKKCNLCVRYDLLPMCRVAHSVQNMR